MTITTSEARELKKRITKFVNASIADANKGATYPEDVPAIKEALRVAKKRLHEYVEMLKLSDGRVRP
jgi:hypothetical protein